MRRLRHLAFACCAALLAGIATPDARATETDQFTLPPRPLDDLGPDMGAIVLEILHAEIALLNSRIESRTQGIPQTTTEQTPERELAAHVYEQTGLGVPEATMERILRYGKYPGRNVRFQPSYVDSIYAWVAAPFPLSHVMTDCPTIRLYGIDQGTDKVGHVFQTGYEYFTRYADARGRGADEASAIASAVQYGVWTELGLYGVMLTGVYSNGDLAANYAGFKFYLNLFQRVRIGDRTMGPIVRFEGARWIIDPDRDNVDLLKPFITEHFNEAFNPSRYFFNVERIRNQVRDRCGNWFTQMPDFDEAGYRARLERTKTWFGEPYGWDLPQEGTATLLECFGPAAQ